MSEETKSKLARKKTPEAAEQSREDRLKSALKANLQRRKAQARARDASEQSEKKE